SEQVAHLLDPCNRLPRFEYQQTCVLLLQSALHFLPRDRRRNRGMLASAQRINSYRSFMFVILAPIDKYLPGSNLLLHVGDDHLRMVVLEQLRQRMGKGLGQFVFSGSIERHVYLQPFGTGRFRKTLQFEMLEDLAQPQPDLAALHNVGGWSG